MQYLKITIILLIIGGLTAFFAKNLAFPVAQNQIPLFNDQSMIDGVHNIITKDNKSILPIDNIESPQKVINEQPVQKQEESKPAETKPIETKNTATGNSNNAFFNKLNLKITPKTNVERPIASKPVLTKKPSLIF